jgi:hypothetical protein
VVAQCAGSRLLSWKASRRKRRRGLLGGASAEL